MLALMIALVACGPAVTTAPVVNAPVEAPVTDSIPEVATAAALSTHDGKRVNLVGTYVHRTYARKMPRPGGPPPETIFSGHIWIEVAGERVGLGVGPRPEAEVERLTGQRVQVQGRLVMQPPIKDPNVAQPMPQPTLFEPGTPVLK